MNWRNSEQRRCFIPERKQRQGQLYFVQWPYLDVLFKRIMTSILNKFNNSKRYHCLQLTPYTVTTPLTYNSQKQKCFGEKWKRNNDWTLVSFRFFSFRANDCNIACDKSYCLQQTRPDGLIISMCRMEIIHWLALWEQSMFSRMIRVDDWKKKQTFYTYEAMTQLPVENVIIIIINLWIVRCAYYGTEVEQLKPMTTDYWLLTTDYRTDTFYGQCFCVLCTTMPVIHSTEQCIKLFCMPSTWRLTTINHSNIKYIVSVRSS